MVAVADVGRNTTEAMGRADPVAELDDVENALELTSVVSIYFGGNGEEAVALDNQRGIGYYHLFPSLPLLALASGLCKTLC